MTRLITKDEVVKFFRGTGGKVTLDALVTAFEADKTNKRVRLANIVSRLEDERKITRFPNSVFQWADYVGEAEASVNEKVN